jgi:serine/threonine-protein kinase HipA
MPTAPGKWTGRIARATIAAAVLVLLAGPAIKFGILSWRAGFGMFVIAALVAGIGGLFSVVSLLPEGWLESVLNDRDERAMLRSGRRYLSNITMAENTGELAVLPVDVLTTPLAGYLAAGVFTGTYAGPGRGAMEQDFEHNLATLYARAETPRLSGVQIKAPMTLSRVGRLTPSVGTPFTHILKPAGTSGFEALALVESVCIELARATGFTVPTTALIAMPEGTPSICSI